MPGLAAAAGLSNTEVTRRCCCCSACYDGEANFQTSWFVITLLTELGVLQVLRTLRPAFRSRPGQLLLWTALGVTVFAFALPILTTSHSSSASRRSRPAKSPSAFSTASALPQALYRKYG